VNQPSDSGHARDEPDARDEYEVLLRCVGRALHLNVKPRVNRGPLAIASAGFSWPVLIGLAHRHEVIPLLNTALVDSASVPAQVRHSLKSHCSTALAHNLSLASELIEVLDLFRRSGINAMPFKGPAWAKVLYGNLAYRQIRDLDIFVDRSEVSRTCQLLGQRGYIHTEPSQAKPIDQCKDLELAHPETGIHLELHWSACEPWHDRLVSRLKLWNPASTTLLLNRPIPLPAAEDIFLLLAIHGARHRWESLKWLCDIGAMLQAFPNLDWGAILSRASKLGRRRMVLLPLALVNRLFDIQLPSLMANAIEQDTAVSWLADYIRQRHYAAASADPGLQTKSVARLIDSERIRIRLRDSMFERFGLLAAFVFRQIKPNANDRAGLPGGKLPAPFYWLLRPYRLMRIYGPGAIGKFAHELIGQPEGPRAGSAAK
jgi:hypothetical protein